MCESTTTNDNMRVRTVVEEDVSKAMHGRGTLTHHGQLNRPRSKLGTVRKGGWVGGGTCGKKGEGGVKRGPHMYGFKSFGETSFSSPNTR